MATSHPTTWRMELAARQLKVKIWIAAILDEHQSSISSKAAEYNKCQLLSSKTFKETTTETLRQKRVVACTTTAAAMYTEELQSFAPGIVLVEEAGEILESHILTALSPTTKQVILIGDHQQLRPKVDNFDLTVAKGDGYDLNRSLFERLILSGLPHTTLSQQHRMCPEISTLVRHLTYPDLTDAIKTKSRPPIRGLQSRVIFINHHHPEKEMSVGDRRDQGSATSKRNKFEADMVLKIVRYLAQQGYGTAEQTVLTPYLGQLSLLRQELSASNDPILNDADSFDLVSAGLLPASSAQQKKQPIKLSTIDNYQGEESEVIIASLTRSNKEGMIGFMAEPERLNVLLSRARDALIIIGNAETFLESRKGAKTWKPFLEMLSDNGQVWDGLPVFCQQHPDVKATLKNAEDFDKHCPDGGCAEPCGTKLACGIHECQSRCHQLADHSKMKCMQIEKTTCIQKHETTYRCCDKALPTCKKCEAEAIRIAKNLQRDHDLEMMRERSQKAYALELSEIQDEIAHERRWQRDQLDLEKQKKTIEQHRQDLANLRMDFADLSMSAKNNASSAHGSNDPKMSPDNSASVNSPQQTSPSAEDRAGSPNLGQPKNGTNSSQPPSLPKEEWEHQKMFENARNDALDEMMSMIGLDNIKDQFLSVKSKVDTTVRQNVDLKGERFGAALLGNPGTGKTTVARLYAKLLASVGALPGGFFVETTGAKLANNGVTGCQKHIDDVLNNGGGAIFIDEAYQLTSRANPGGSAVLDFLLVEAENLNGKIVFILAGYNKQMESFFAHNPGIPSRFPMEMHFKDYEDNELLEILKYRIEKRYGGRMEVELGTTGLYARIVSRRIGRGRGTEGFGNARAVENVISRITNNQAKRLRKERTAGVPTDDLQLTRVDMIGPEPSDILSKNGSWVRLQKLTGLETVKDSIKALFDSISTNYQRELDEQPYVDFTLNKVFLGSPGTGKTTVAKLYGQILADIGLLSNGEIVIKTPADFIGDVIGGSEAKTKGILASTVGKVLVIDEAYGLYGGANAGGGDIFRTAVIDTIVGEVQSVPGDDRCVLLIGYKDQMEEMFQNVNPGLTRRFPLDSAFVFEDFTQPELSSIFDFKIKQQGFTVTPEAKKTAMDVLGRARNRPNFGNAGEVDNLLNAAKLRQQKRISKYKGSIGSMFEAEDIDPDFDRGQRAVTNVDKLFENTVGCEDIVAQLKGYQITVAKMRVRDMDPREQIPFAFLFRGPPGTGKTTTARRMGKVYFDMGFLSTAEVVECSATDLVGSYIGQTGPKTQKQLEKALGKVLFIDEAYRLAEGQFAKEAMDEIIDCLTKPQFFQKLVVILAGYDAEINRLISTNPGLTSRFPETVVFKGMDPQSCVKLLTQLLNRKKGLDTSALSPMSPTLAADLVDCFKTLAGLPNWGSARDIETVVKAVFNRILRSAQPTDTLLVTKENILDELRRMITERQHRGQHDNARSTTGAVPHLPSMFGSGHQHPTTTSTSQTNKPKEAEHSSEELPEKDDASSSDEPPGSTIDSRRDAGVTDEVWQQLQADKKAAIVREREYQEALKEEQEMREAMDKLVAEEVQRLKEANAKAEQEREEAKRERERIRVEKQRQIREIKQKRLEVEEQRRKEAAAMEKLARLGVCSAGYQWIRQDTGYRCAGGAHYMSDGQLGSL